jgi:glucose/arabinose dehydrogenase
MRSHVKRFVSASSALAGAILLGALGALGTVTVSTQAPPKCDPDNGGLKLPDGFCAAVVADNIGPARHLTVAPNGDVFVSLQTSGGRGAPQTGGGVVALRDSDGDGRLETKEAFGQGSVTGIALRNGYLYLAKFNSVERFKMTPGQLKPASVMPEIVVSGLPGVFQHGDKGIAFDGKGGLYVNVGAPSNACQQPDRRPGAKGQDPCPLLEKNGGIWKFDENKLGQMQEDGVRFATGLRQMPAITWHDDAVYIAMNNRDQLDVFWPDTFTAQDNSERPAEPLYRAEQGANFGWPYCFYDYGQKKFLLNPEYGGDGKTVGRCADFTPPVASFPAHWAPVDLMFYTGNQFPAKYRGGAFIAFHGSWNRTPQAGYNVTFQPFTSGKASGMFEVFADGFTGKSTPLTNPGDASARPDGVAQGPDGSLYITESNKGKMWRVFYRGK